MKRRAFVCSLAAGWFVPAAARATGGLDVGDAATGRPLRILLATGERIAEPEPLDAWRFAWNGRTYRGAFAFVAIEGRGRALVNSVPLDAYLGGVLGAEISSAWPAAALEAQAIVSRTYVLGKMQPRHAYDITAFGGEQGYAGIEGESVEARAAVDATSGTIVAFEGERAQVAFSACCGGRTADSGDVWRTSYPYLRSRVDPNCAGSPGYAWRAEIPCETLAAPLGLDRAGALRSVSLLGPDGSGRARAVAFAGDGTTVDVAAAEFRTAAGAHGVYSTFLRSVALSDDRATLSVAGNGRGHGVGLCQWGAHGMAANGARPDEIVAFYFPGTSLAAI